MINMGSDVSHPSSPWLVGSCDVPGWAHEVAVAGAHAYIASHFGDANTDYAVDILDALFVVNIILQAVEPTPDQEYYADCNGAQGLCDGDGVVDILDGIKIVNLILGVDSCP